MLLSCPNCRTEYEVPEAALAGRARTLRCDRCMTKWRAPALPGSDAPLAGGEAEFSAPEMAAADPSPAPPAGTPEAPTAGRVGLLKSRRAGATEPAPRKDRRLAISGLLAALIIVALLLAHRAIGAFWPPSLRLFDALGLR